MSRKRFFAAVFFLLVGGLVLVACQCTPSGGGGVTCADGAAVRTQGCDEFYRISATVTQYRGGSVRSCAGPWCQLITNDQLMVNATGQAELNFSDCWPGRLYLFRISSLQPRVNSCTKAEYCPGGNCSNPPAACVSNGALYTDQCSGEFDPVTGSAKIVKTESSYLLTYQPEMGDVSVVVVAQGMVQVEPVAQFDPLTMGELVEVNGGEFIFTMPDDQLREIGGLKPRDKYPLEMLPPVAQELGIEDWLFDAAQIARERGELPPNWPRELGGDFVPGEPPDQPAASLVVTADGGGLADVEVQTAIYQAIDWNALPSSLVVLMGERVNPLEATPFDPDKSAELLGTRFQDGLVLQLLFPAEDPELEGAAAMIAEFLAQVGVKVEISPTPGAELMPRVQTMLAAGEQLIYLTR